MTLMRILFVWLAISTSLFAQLSTTKVGGSGTSKVGGTGTTKVARQSGLIFEWHAENVDVTLGTPAGRSVGDTTATANSGVNLSTTQVYDGTYSIQVPTASDNYQFTWASSPAITIPAAGTIDFRVYFTTIGGQTLFEMYVDANNRILISIDAGNSYLLLTRVSGGTTTYSRTVFPAFVTGAWYHVKARWDTIAHNTLYSRISCDLTNGETGSADNGTDAPGTFAGTSGTVKFGDTNGAAGVFYLDAIYIYNQWVVETEVYYADPSFVGTSNGTTTNPYVSANAAIAAKCNRLFVNPIQIRGRTSASTPDTTRIDTGGLGQMVPTETCYLEIIADTGQRAGASWDSTKYHLYPAYAVSAGTAINIDKAWIRIEGLQIGISSQTGTAEIVYLSGSGDTIPKARMTGCLTQGRGSATYITRGLSTQAVELINCIIYNIGTGPATDSVCVQTHSNLWAYSCTFIGGGLHTVNFNGAFTAVTKNSYAGGASSECWHADGGGSYTQTNCASADATSSGTAPQDNIPLSTATFANITAGTENWSLPGGSGLLDVGANTSGEAAPFNFTTDITGATRTVPWSIGAVE